MILSAVKISRRHFLLCIVRYTWPDGDTVDYDIRSPRQKWVISSINGEKTDRNYDYWPLMDKTN